MYSLDRLDEIYFLLLLSGVFAPKRALKKEIKPPFWQVFEKKVECMILYAKTTS